MNQHKGASKDNIRNIS